jgi:hypothetical protein
MLLRRVVLVSRNSCPRSFACFCVSLKYPISFTPADHSSPDLTMSGEKLALEEVHLALAWPNSSELVFIETAR